MKWLEVELSKCKTLFLKEEDISFIEYSKTKTRIYFKDKDREPIEATYLSKKQIYKLIGIIKENKDD